MSVYGEYEVLNPIFCICGVNPSGGSIISAVASGPIGIYKTVQEDKDLEKKHPYWVKTWWGGLFISENELKRISGWIHKKDYNATVKDDHAGQVYNPYTKEWRWL